MKPLQQQRSTQDLAALGHFVKDAVHDVINDKSNNTASAKKRPAEDKDNKSKPNKSPHPKPKKTRLALLPSYGRASISRDNSALTPYQPTKPMLFYGRLIDDTLSIWDTALLPEDMSLRDFCLRLASTMKYGILNWEVDPPAQEVNSLDLTLRIQPDGTINTNKHQAYEIVSLHPTSICPFPWCP
jgi:hypothetical protein